MNGGFTAARMPGKRGILHAAAFRRLQPSLDPGFSGTVVLRVLPEGRRRGADPLRRRAERVGDAGGRRLRRQRLGQEQPRGRDGGHEADGVVFPDPRRAGRRGAAPAVQARPRLFRGAVAFRTRFRHRRRAPPLRLRSLRRRLRIRMVVHLPEIPPADAVRTRGRQVPLRAGAEGAKRRHCRPHPAQQPVSFGGGSERTRAAFRHIRVFSRDPRRLRRRRSRRGRVHTADQGGTGYSHDRLSREDRNRGRRLPMGRNRGPGRNQGPAEGYHCGVQQAIGRADSLR